MSAVAANERRGLSTRDGPQRKEITMTSRHALSHLFTFLLLGGIMVTLGCLLLDSGTGLYA